MTTDFAQATRRSSAYRFDAVTLLRGVGFIVAYLYFWISLDPFPDLSDPSVLQPAKSSGLANQSVAAMLGGFSLLFVYGRNWRRLRPLFTPLFITVLLWCALSVVTSPHSEVAARRYVLTLITMTIAAVTLLLPRDERHFGELIAITAGLFLGVCYAGVLLFPQLAVHQFSDLNEPQLAGAWRGVFTHKNGAGSAMVLMAFIGIYVARTRSLLVGSLITIASIVFLLCTLSKTSLALLPVTLLATWALLSTRSARARIITVVSGLLLFNVCTIGSAFYTPVHDVLERILFDPSFTNRDAVWRFAISQLVQRPLTGYGFQAFWRLEDVVYSGSAMETWTVQASDGHNGYLDLAITLGIPGLILLVLWLVVAPINDIRLSEKSGNDPALTGLFTQIWLFGIMHGCLETTFFIGGSPNWFMMSVAVFGLRLQGSSSLIAGASKRP